jgi:hypothetical protein
LRDGAEQNSILARAFAPVKPFPKNYNILKPSDRWAYGMQAMYGQVPASSMPKPGTTTPEINSDGSKSSE